MGKSKKSPTAARSNDQPLRRFATHNAASKARKRTLPVSDGLGSSLALQSDPPDDATPASARVDAPALLMGVGDYRVNDNNHATQGTVTEEQPAIQLVGAFLKPVQTNCEPSTTSEGFQKTINPNLVFDPKTNSFVKLPPKKENKGTIPPSFAEAWAAATPEVYYSTNKTGAFLTDEAEWLAQLKEGAQKDKGAAVDTEVRNNGNVSANISNIADLPGNGPTDGAEKTQVELELNARGSLQAAAILAGMSAGPPENPPKFIQFTPALVHTDNLPRGSTTSDIPYHPELAASLERCEAVRCETIKISLKIREDFYKQLKTAEAALVALKSAADTMKDCKSREDIRTRNGIFAKIKERQAEILYIAEEINTIHDDLKEICLLFKEEDGSWTYYNAVQGWVKWADVEEGDV